MKLIINVLFTALVFCLVNACQNSKNTTEITTSVNFESILKGVLKGAGEEGFKQEVIKVTSHEELKKVLNNVNSINREINDDFISDHVFFEDYMLLFVFDKVRGTGGYKLNVENVKSSKNEIIINTHIKSPENNAPSLMTQPFEVVQLEKSDKKINAVFIE